MELGKFKNLLQPENARLIPLAAYGLIKGLARMAIYEMRSTPKGLEERQAASIQYYNTGEQSGEGLPQDS
jgi:hypothetical protein